MQLTSLALFLLTLASSVSAYPTKAELKCRTGPGTNNNVVKTYPPGFDLTLSCQTRGQSIKGNTLWDKTQDGCYVSDFYVKTGTSAMVVGNCGAGGGGGPPPPPPPPPPPAGGGNSAYQGSINRAEIISRGRFWTNKHIPYSMSGSSPDPKGRSYRTDCSGFVSMALHAMSPGYSTVSLPSITKPISAAELLPGDIIGTLGPGTGGAAGHVTLFLSWANTAHTSYNTLECRGSKGCVADTRPYPWKDGSFTAKPYRYLHVVD